MEKKKSKSRLKGNPKFPVWAVVVGVAAIAIIGIVIIVQAFAADNIAGLDCYPDSGRVICKNNTGRYLGQPRPYVRGYSYQCPTTLVGATVRCDATGETLNRWKSLFR